MVLQEIYILQNLFSHTFTVSQILQKVTQKSLLFFSPPIASNHWVFPLTKVSASKVPAILKKFVSKEAQNSTLETAIPKLYSAAKPSLCDVILSNSKLAGSRETCNRLGTPHKVSKMYFFQVIIHLSLSCLLSFLGFGTHLVQNNQAAIT